MRCGVSNFVRPPIDQQAIFLLLPDLFGSPTTETESKLFSRLVRSRHAGIGILDPVKTARVNSLSPNKQLLI